MPQRLGIVMKLEAGWYSNGDDVALRTIASAAINNFMGLQAYRYERSEPTQKTKQFYKSENMIHSQSKLNNTGWEMSTDL